MNHKGRALQAGSFGPWEGFKLETIFLLKGFLSFCWDANGIHMKQAITYPSDILNMPSNVDTVQRGFGIIVAVHVS